MRWISRILAFLWAYMYHDWQSLVILAFLLHSTFYLQASTFRKWIVYFYMPSFVLIFLWYYIINIQGLIQWDSVEQTKKVNLFDYGFY
jgi:cytochrome c-type biogenesis protein CcmE